MKFSENKRHVFLDFGSCTAGVLNYCPQTDRKTGRPSLISTQNSSEFFVALLAKGKWQKRPNFIPVFEYCKSPPTGHFKSLSFGVSIWVPKADIVRQKVFPVIFGVFLAEERLLFQLPKFLERVRFSSRLWLYLKSVRQSPRSSIELKYWVLILYYNQSAVVEKVGDCENVSRISCFHSDNPHSSTNLPGIGTAVKLLQLLWSC